METRIQRRRLFGDGQPSEDEDDDTIVLVQVLCLRADGAVLLRKNGEEAGSLSGLWAGILGPVEDGETLEDAARRLTAPLHLDSLKRVACFRFIEEEDPVEAVEHEFIASCSGSLPDGAVWVPRSELDFASMPADDAFWYGRVLDGELLVGDFSFGSANVLLSHNVRALNVLIDDDEGSDDGSDAGSDSGARVKPYTRVKTPDGGINEIRFVD